MIAESQAGMYVIFSQVSRSDLWINTAKYSVSFVIYHAEDIGNLIGTKLLVVNSVHLKNEF